MNDHKHDNRTAYCGFARALTAALAEALDVELHPAGTAEVLAALQAQRAPDPIGYSEAALVGMMLWTHRTDRSATDAAREAGLLEGNRPTRTGLTVRAEVLRRLGITDTPEVDVEPEEDAVDEPSPICSDCGRPYPQYRADVGCTRCSQCARQALRAAVVVESGAQVQHYQEVARG